MVMLVVLVILWRVPCVMRVPERSQVVWLLLRRTRRRVGLLDWRKRWTRWWWVASVMLLLMLLLLLLLVLLMLGRMRGRRMLLLLRLLLLLDRRRWWLRMGCWVVVLRLVGVLRWWWRSSVVTMRRLGVRRRRWTRSSFHDERKMQPCGQGCSLWDYLSKTIGGRGQDQTGER
jgi:hypothetical protein